MLTLACRDLVSKAESLNRKLDTLAEAYAAEIESIKSLYYGRPSVWAYFQNKPTAILCSCPAEKRGLPICLFDPIFSHFGNDWNAPLPPTRTAVTAWDVAGDLCTEMSTFFETKLEMSTVFDGCFQPIVPELTCQKDVRVGLATVDRVYSYRGTPILMREDQLKHDPDHYAHMSLYRKYQIQADLQRKEGMPMILLCVIGM